MNLLFLLPNGDDCAAATQVRLLAPRFGADVVLLSDVGWRGLRRRLAMKPPDIVHAWRLPALRAAGTLKLVTRAPWKVVVSDALRGGRANPIDHWLLARADRVVTLPLAVASQQPVPLPVDLPTGARLAMVLGPVKASHGGRDAVWACDIVKYVARDLHLVIVGDGPDLRRLRAFVGRAGGATEFTHFVPRRSDAAALLPHADVVLVPSRAGSGRQVILEAQAAGVPVVATRVPGPADLIDDGVTGILVPPHDPPSLATALRQLLEDDNLRRRIGDAGRSAAAAHAPDAIAEQWRAVYTGLA